MQRELFSKELDRAWIEKRGTNDHLGLCLDVGFRVANAPAAGEDVVLTFDRGRVHSNWFLMSQWPLATNPYLANPRYIELMRDIPK